MLRNKLGITKAILAKECGVVRQTVNCIENDKYEPTFELALNMAKVLNSRIDEVFMYD
ncbi:helix-turn-helix transcriptional regulator [Lysinibacillus sphaericus]|jgi:putative transcriptional regulator